MNTSDDEVLEVLLVEDSPVDVALVTGLLDQGTAPRFRVTTVGCLGDATELVTQRQFQVVLLDLMLPDSRGLDTFHRLLQYATDLPIVLLTGLDDEAVALEALRHGAQDYLIKTMTISALLLARSIRYAVERKRAELEIRRLTAELEQNKAEEALRRTERLASIGTMAAGIAHEINNPIAAALNSAHAALRFKDDPKGGPHLEECLNNVLRSAERCSQIVRNVLRFARQEPEEKQLCDLNEVAHNALSVSSAYGKSHGASIELVLAHDLPKVWINTVAIEQVLVNLIRNAIESGSGQVQVTIRTGCTTGGVRLTVEDDGRGITPEQKVHAFDPFYSTRYDQGGTGLGLSIAHGIVQSHGGTIEVEGEFGGGTVVAVELPIGSDGAKMLE